MRARELLIESQDYMGMFASALDLVAPHQLAEETKHVQFILSDTLRVTKNRDRVTYFLRWRRLNWMVGTYNNQPETFRIGAKAAVEQIIIQWARAAGLQVNSCPEAKTSFAQQWMSMQLEIEHYCTIREPVFQQVQFGRKLPSQLSSEFRAVEEEWQRKQGSLLDVSKVENGVEPQVFLKLDNEWAWYLLPTWYCKDEGRAMGHCGNGGGNQDRDQILSLRHHIEDTIYRPSLTFIFKDDSMLGEMKGRANKKPAQKYHEAIKALLLDPRIKGIEGGGHAPEQNFSIFDLSEDDAIALLDKKPRLANMTEITLKYAEFSVDANVPKFIRKLFLQMMAIQAERHRANLDNKANRIIWHDWTLDVWLKHCLWDNSPSERVLRFFEDYEIPKGELFNALLRQTIPFDHYYRMQSVVADIEDGKVVEYSPYMTVAKAYAYDESQTWDGEVTSVAMIDTLEHPTDDSSPQWSQYHSAMLEGYNIGELNDDQLSVLQALFSNPRYSTEEMEHIAGYIAKKSLT